MGLSRYDILDAYTLEELRRAYQASDAKGRIRLLRKLYRGHAIAPFEIAELAVKDDNVKVREWIARHGKFYEHQEGHKQLVVILKHDADPFVRACLRENPAIFSEMDFIFDWQNHIRDATHLERLALMRNPSLSFGFEPIRRIFDPEDTELGISLEERQQLALACLANPHVLRQSGRLDSHEFFDGAEWYTVTEPFRKLWELASKWPAETKIPYMIYRYVGTDDDTKAKAYSNCSNHFPNAKHAAVLKYAILEGCTVRNRRTLELGMKDTSSDDSFDCRELAYSKADVRRMSAERLDELLNSGDQATLAGLARNDSLSIEALEKVRSRLYELDHDLDADDASRTIERILNRRSQEKPDERDQPDELLDTEDQESSFLGRKLDFIESSLSALEPEAKELKEETKELKELLRTATQKLDELVISVKVLFALGIVIAILILLTR